LGNFGATLDDDLNVSAAWGVVFDWVRETNRRLTAGGLQPADAATALAAWQRLDTVCCLGTKAQAEAPADVLALLVQRQAARKAKDFQRADTLRVELKTRGWLIEDTSKGARLRRV
jgi:cysteinyl-tRNA synthetase